MARLDTIRALEKRGLSPELAEKTVDLGYLLGTLKKSDLKTLRKDFYYKDILQLIDVSKNKLIDREDIVAKALERRKPSSSILASSAIAQAHNWSRI